MHGLSEIRTQNEESYGTCRGFKIPNLQARNIVSDTCATIVESTTWGDWTEKDRDMFAIGYVRGRFDQLKHDRNPATADFAGTLLAQVAGGGIEFVRRMVEEVTGRGYNERN